MHSSLVMDEMKHADSYSSERRKGSRTLMCAVDGSVGSESAFHAMMLMRRKLDHVCIFHTYSTSKENSSSCPSQFRNDEIREHYLHELTSTYQLPTTKFSFVWEDRRGRTVNEVIGDMLKGYKGIRNPMSPTQQPPDIFLCGFAGRRRSFSFSSTDEDDIPTGPGKTADFAVRNFFIPTIVVKYTPVFESHQRCIVVAVDGTPASYKGYELSLSLLTPKDKIICVTVDTHNGSDIDARPLEKSVHEIRSLYEEEMSHGHVRDCSFEVITCEGSKNVAESICEFAVHHASDYLCIAPRAEASLSSVTEYVIVHSHCSVILAKG
jgi:hypothetical protein